MHAFSGRNRVKVRVRGMKVKIRVKVKVRVRNGKWKVERQHTVVATAKETVSILTGWTAAKATLTLTLRQG